MSNQLFSGAPLTLTQRIASENNAGTLNLSRTPSVPAIPAPTSSTPENLRKTIQPIKQWIDQREGSSGSVMDKFLTLRDLYNEGAITLTVGSANFSGTNPSAISVGSGYVDPRPTFLVPPTPTALTAQGAFKNVVLDWSLINYANFAFVEVYRSATNARGTAVLIGTSTSNLYTDANVTVGSTYYYWIRAINIDGAYGADNAVGGTSAALLVIGNTDLGALVVSAEKLSAGTYPNINLVPNGSAEDTLGTQPVAWAIAATYGTGGAFLFGNTAGFAAGGTNYFRINNAGTPANSNAAGCLAFPVIPGETYSVKLRVQASSVSAAGLYIQILEKITYPVGGFINGSNYDTAQNLLSDGPTTNAGWVAKEFTYTPTAGRYWASIVITHFTTTTATNLFWDDVSVGRQITASFLAANSIAVGTAAIQNLALVNGMFANLAVDNAKIANLDGAKINANTITAGQIAAGTITATEIAAHTITAAKIAANTITASEIFGGTITATELAAGSVTATKISVASLAAINATLGTITSGTINTGSLLLGSGGNIRQGQSAYNTGTGFWLGDVAGTAKFSIGNAGTNALTWDGTTLTLAGALSAASGTFAGTLTTAAITLAGNTLFTPTLATSSSTTNVTTSLVAVLTSASVNPGATGTVLISVHCEFLNGNSTNGAGEDGIVSTFVTPTFSIYRNTGSVLVGSWTPVIGVNSPERQITMEFAVDTPAAASTYSLKVQSGAFGIGGDPKVFRRTLLVESVVR